MAIAEALDAERAATGARGPMHGVCVLLKDNVDTGDSMHTTAGSLALVDSVPAAGDATIVKKLRAAGARTSEGRRSLSARPAIQTVGNRCGR